MTLLFNSNVYTVGEMLNDAFRKKATRNTIQAMYDLAAVSEPFDMYDFQDEVSLVGAINKGSGGFLGNMAWTNFSQKTGSGWYTYPAPGAMGLGMVGVGGADPEVGSVASHTGNNLAGQTKATFLFKIRMNGTGGGGGGRIGEAGASYIIFANAANEIAVSIYDGGAWHSNSTGANVVYGFWHDLAIVFDGTQVGDAARCRVILDGQDVTTVLVAGMPAAMVDPGAIRYILNGFTAGAFNRAFDGDLGFYGVFPALAMSLAQVRSLIEIRGLFQPTVANQPTIITPGHFGAPEYNFDGAASPNSDHLLTFQSQPLKTQQGTVLTWIMTDEFVNAAAVWGMATEGVSDDEYMLRLRGGLAGDPLEIAQVIGGIFDSRLRSGADPLIQGVTSIGWTSDSLTNRMFLDGEEETIVVTIGANTGQWFGDVVNGNVFSIGVLRRGPTIFPFNGIIIKTLIYDRALSPLEIQQIQQRGFTPRGPRWYPDR